MKKKQEEDVSTMFLVPKRIYLALREVISEDDKLNQLDQLNKGTNYIEDAIQFKQQKSYKTQPEDLKKTVSTLVNTFNNIEQPAQMEINTLPARNSEELSQNGFTSVPPSSGSQPDGPNFIFPPVNPTEAENVKHQKEITLSHQEIASENLLNNEPQPQHCEPSNIDLKKKNIVPPKLRCPFCNYATYSRVYFLMQHLRNKHNYRASLEEERLARETLEKAKIERNSNKTKEPLPSFRGKRKNISDEDESGIPSKRRKRDCLTKNYDENEPLSKLRRNVKNKKLNAKPTKKKVKKSTFDENEPLSKLRRQGVKTKKEKKESRKLTVDEIPKQDEKVFKLRKNPFYMKPYKKYNTKKEKKELKKLTVDEILKQDGKLFKLRKNPFYKKPCENFDENEPLSKLRRNVKNKKINAKPTKRKLKESTFDENEPLSKLRHRGVKTKKEKKELKKLTDDEIQLFKLRKNPFYKKPYKNYDENEPLSKLRRNSKKKNPFYKKPFPKLIVRKF